MPLYSYHGTLGHYRVSSQTGLITATLAADKSLLSFRWTNSSKICVLRAIEASCVISAAITTAVHFGLAVFFARAFTASDSGGTDLKPSGNNAKKLTSMSASAVGDLRIAGTAGLTEGTRTLDANPFASLLFGTGTVVGSTPLPISKLYKPEDYEYPVVFAQDDGFVIRNPFAGPATGTFVVNFAVAWEEVPSMQYV